MLRPSPVLPSPGNHGFYMGNYPQIDGPTIQLSEILSFTARIAVPEAHRSKWSQLYFSRSWIESVWLILVIGWDFVFVQLATLSKSIMAIEINITHFQMVFPWRNGHFYGCFFHLFMTISSWFYRDLPGGNPWFSPIAAWTSPGCAWNTADQHAWLVLLWWRPWLLSCPVGWWLVRHLMGGLRCFKHQNMVIYLWI